MKIVTNANGMPEKNADGTPKIEWNGSNIRFGIAGRTFDEMKQEFGDRWQEREMGFNATLRREDIQFVEQQVIAPHLAALNGRNLVGHVTDVDPATEQYQYDKWTHMGAAEFVGKKGRRPRDEVGMSRTSVTLMEISKGWSLNRRELLAKRTIIEAINKESALQQCMEKENSMIFESADYPDIDGLIDDAGNTDAASNVWSSAAGTRLPYEDINTAVGLNRADGFDTTRKGGYYSDQYTELHARDTSAGGGGVTYASLVVPTLLSEILHCPGCTDGTGVIVDQRPGVAAVLRAEEFMVRIFPMNSDHRVDGDVTGVTSIMVQQPNGVCSQTSL